MASVTASHLTPVQFVVCYCLISLYMLSRCLCYTCLWSPNTYQYLKQDIVSKWCTRSINKPSSLSVGYTSVLAPLTGKGGGLACVFKSTFYCWEVSADGCSSFELHHFETQVPFTMLCAVVYRPPKFNKDFIQDFADIMAGVVLKYDRLVIVGDFNVRVCGESKPLLRDFLNLIDSFNLT